MSSIAIDAGDDPAGVNACLFDPEADGEDQEAAAGHVRLYGKGLEWAPLALMATAAIVAVMFWLQPAANPEAEALKPPPVNQWVEINRPLPFYALSGSEFGREPRLEARRHKTGGGRVDTLSFGQPSDDRKPWMRLSLYRIGGEDAFTPGFFVEMVRRAAEIQVAVVRSAAPDVTPTRFGDFDTADVTLLTPTGEKSCLGFRFGAQSSDFRMSGLACGTAARPVDRTIFTCTIDRLDLLAAGEDPAMSGFFAAAEAGRGKGCMQSRLTSAAARENWLDANGRQPPLRATLQQVAHKSGR